MPSSHLILCRPLLLPPIPPGIRVFSNESTLHMRWPKYWSFSFSIIPSKEIPGWISFRMDWLDLLAVQGTLKSLLQHHSSKASILWRSAFFSPTLTSIHDCVSPNMETSKMTGQRQSGTLAIHKPCKQSSFYTSLKLHLCVLPPYFASNKCFLCFTICVSAEFFL